MSLFPETIDIKTTIQIKHNTSFKILPLLRLSKRRGKTGGSFCSDPVAFHPLAKTTVLETALNHRCSGSELPDELNGAITEPLPFRDREKWIEMEFLLIYEH